MLLSSAYIHLQCKEFIKYTTEIASASQRILLSGPIGNNTFNIYLFLNFYLFLHQRVASTCTGSEIYQETLVKALAKHFGVRLLVIESLVLPGVSIFHCSLSNLRTIFLKLGEGERARA